MAGHPQRPHFPTVVALGTLPTDAAAQNGTMADERAAPRRVRRRAIVHGRVQGVFFRDSCRAEAQAAGLGGFVRNLEDGTVEACFEGPVAAVNRLVAWCHTGPPSAWVASVDVTDERPIGELTFKTR